MHQLINPDTSTLPFLFVNELRLLVLRFLGSSQVMGGGGSVYRLSDCLLSLLDS